MMECCCASIRGLYRQKGSGFRGDGCVSNGIYLEFTQSYPKLEEKPISPTGAIVF